MATKLLEVPLCDNCFGRQFSTIGKGMTNKKRGKKIRVFLNHPQCMYQNCQLCSGLMGEIKKFSRLVIKALRNYEYDTFLIGSIIADDIKKREEELKGSIPYGEPIKQEVNREIGKIVEKKIGKEAEFMCPDITVLVDTTFDQITLDIRSLYIHGRYWKLIRGIPQTKWYCKRCRGQGCPDCGNKGKMYQESVEELIASRIIEDTGGTGESFHGAGREDIDAKMLGNGRPFVLEIRQPIKRNMDFTILEKKINESLENRIHVEDLHITSKEEIKHLKAASWEKTYRVTINGVSDERKLKEAVAILGGSKLCQRTPTRVVHRRSDLVRERQIKGINIEEIIGTRAIITVRAEAGTYIKEFISGDGGRTVPSLSGVLEEKLEIEKLDVIHIHDEGWINGKEIERDKKQN